MEKCGESDEISTTKNCLHLERKALGSYVVLVAISRLVIGRQ